MLCIMSNFLYKLGSRSYRKVWPFLAFWIVVLIGAGVLASNFAKAPNPSFSMPDMDSTITQEEMSERIELAIGRDLQFIRINGTLVGGLVGLAIHAVTQWLG